MINNLEVVQEDNLKKNQNTFLFTFPSSKYKDLFFHLPLTLLAKSHTIMIEKGYPPQRFSPAAPTISSSIFMHLS